MRLSQKLKLIQIQLVIYKAKIYFNNATINKIFKKQLFKIVESKFTNINDLNLRKISKTRKNFVIAQK